MSGLLSSTVFPQIREDEYGMDNRHFCPGILLQYLVRGLAED